jgi:DNA repair exonuclease SbcCD nuclease subunit
VLAGDVADVGVPTFAVLGNHDHHAGSERGTTPGGVPVRNVSEPVIGAAYRIYCLGGSDQPACDPAEAAA